MENYAVRTLDLQGGEIAGVETAKGRLRARSVLVAGGIWSSLLLRHHGLRLPQVGVRGTVVATAALSEFYAGNAVEKRSIAFRRRLDGGYTLAAGTRNLLHLGPEALLHSLKYFHALKLDPLGTSVHPFAPRHYPDAWKTTQHWEAAGESPFEKMRVLNPEPVKTGRPVASLDLQSHACLRQRSPSDGKLHVWPLQVGKTGEVIGEELVPETMCASTTAPLVQLAEGGMGIAFLPPFAVAEQLISGKLISLLSEYVVQTGEILALWSTSRQLSKKRVFVDYLLANMEMVWAKSGGEERA